MLKNLLNQKEENKLETYDPMAEQFKRWSAKPVTLMQFQLGSQNEAK